MKKFLLKLLGVKSPSRAAVPAEDTAPYIVQLHRAEAPDGGTVKILNSWAPIHVTGLREAEQKRRELYSANQWGGPIDFPYVTVSPRGYLLVGDQIEEHKS